MSTTPVSIGLSLHKDKCYYLIWIPSESGPLIIDYGNVKVRNNKIPFSSIVHNVEQHIDIQFTLSLNNDYVKYSFLKSYDNLLIDEWNENNSYDNDFINLYDSYLYESLQGIFSIHILKKIKENISEQLKEKNYPLINLGVGIFSALEGVRAWYKVNNLNRYIVMKFSKKRVIELLLIEKNNFSGYMIIKKTSSNFKTLNYFGPDNSKELLLKVVASIFKGDFNSIVPEIFYYSIDGNKEDVDFIFNSNASKIQLINPFKNLSFDDNCKKNIKDINSSAYCEIGNVFRGIDA